MVDTLSLPTVFFTLSAADLQWPELADLLDVDEPQNSAARSRAVVENPCLTDWFFYHRVIKFMDVVFTRILNANNYWLRFEYQHRDSPHVHGVVWLQDAPDVENILATNDVHNQEDLIRYIDRIVSTILLLSVMVVIYQMLHHPRLILTFVTYDTQRSRITIKI